MLGSSSSTLGVRVPGGLGIPDIVPDSDGHVSPGTGGMSVSPSIRQLPLRLIPRRLNSLVPGAIGNNNLFVWRTGEGPFAPGPVADRLVLRPDPRGPGHGFVEPAQRMPLEEYVLAIQATRDQWVVDEELEQP